MNLARTDCSLAGSLTSLAAREEGGRRRLCSAAFGGLLSLTHYPFSALSFSFKTGNGLSRRSSAVRACNYDVLSPRPMDKGVALCRAPPPTPCCARRLSSGLEAQREGRTFTRSRFPNGAQRTNRPTDRRRSRNITGEPPRSRRLLAFAHAPVLARQAPREVYRSVPPRALRALLGPRLAFPLSRPCFARDGALLHFPPSLTSGRCPPLIEPACLIAS